MRARVVARMVMICFGVAALCGCGTYPHNTLLENQTAKIKTDFAALKAPAFLASERTKQISLGVQEDTAVAALSTATRNLVIINALRPPPLAKKRDAVGALRDLADLQLGQLYRTPSHPPWTEYELTALSNARLAMQFDDQALATDQSDVAAARRNFVTSNVTSNPQDVRTTDCAKTEPLPQPLPPNLLQQDPNYTVLRQACDALNALALDPGIAGVLAEATGELRQVQDHVVALRLAMAKQEADGLAIQAKIKALKASPPGPDGVQALNAQLAEISADLRNAEPLTRLLGLQALSDTLQPALTHALAPDVAMPAGSPPNAQEVSNAIVLLRAAIGADHAFNAPPDPNSGDALLIANAALSHELATDQLEADRDQKIIDLAELELQALLLKAQHLVRVHNLLSASPALPPIDFADLRDPKAVTTNTARARLSEALTAYVAAWDTGETPFRVLQFREVQVQRAAAVDLAARAEADYRAVLSPAIDQLAAGGAGGVKPGTFVTLLGHFAIAAAILGK